MNAMTLRRKLDTILLIDDNKPTNIYHKKLINKADIATHVDTVTNAREGLEYLARLEKYPDLILLDINMPDMNGWDFVAEFNTLPMAHQKESTVIMLSTSPNPRDKQRALLMDAILDYKVKPLSVEMLQQIIDEHFEE